MKKDHTPASVRTGATSTRHRSIELALCMLLFIVGCGKNEPENSEGVGDPQTAPPGTTVRLLDPGAEPRAALRYTFQPNQSEKMIMEMNLAMTVEVGDQKQPETKVPTTRTSITLDGKSVSPEGDLRYEFKLDKIDVLTEPGANPAMVSAMKQSMSSMAGLSGSATVTSRGFTKDAKINIPPGIDPQVEQAMENVRKSMNQMSAPLPVEPVGQGARWVVTMPIETSGLIMTQTATYTLSELQGDTARCAVTIEQSALPQEMNVPGAAPGTKMMLESLNSSGTGTMELLMTSLVPTSDVNMTTTTVVSANDQKIKTTMKLGIKIHPPN